MSSIFFKFSFNLWFEEILAQYYWKMESKSGKRNAVLTAAILIVDRVIATFLKQFYQTVVVLELPDVSPN